LTTRIVVPGHRVEAGAKEREGAGRGCNDRAIPPKQAGHQGNHSSGNRCLVQAITHPNPSTCNHMKSLVNLNIIQIYINNFKSLKL